MGMDRGTRLMKRKGSWGLFKKEVITDESGSPYIKRWRILETPWFGIFVHKILRSDSDRHLHDHPWNFLTILLKGDYIEELGSVKNNVLMSVDIIERKRWSIIRHKAEDLHRITLKEKRTVKDFCLNLNPKPVWTLFITGRKRREWGFQTEKGWVHNNKYEK